MNLLDSELEASILRDVKPGDILVLKFKAHLSVDLVDKLRQHLAGNMPEGVKVFVFGDDSLADIFVHCQECPHWDGRKQSALEMT